MTDLICVNVARRRFSDESEVDSEGGTGSIAGPSNQCYPFIENENHPPSNSQFDQFEPSEVCMNSEITEYKASSRSSTNLIDNTVFVNPRKWNRRRCIFVTNPLKYFIFFVIFLLFFSRSCAQTNDITDEVHRETTTSGYRQYYKNEWSIKIASGLDRDADALATKYEFINKGRIIPNDNYFLFVKPNIKSKTARKARRSLDKVLSADGKVLEVMQQLAKRRVKRDLLRIRRAPAPKRWNTHLLNHIAEDYYDGDEPVHFFMAPNDPLWADMWYLHRSEYDGEMDHNVKEAWLLGYTGKGVVVTILDDGLEHTHPDIKPNYDPKASYDVNDRDDDPTPRYDYSDENRHGTRCAGEVASVMNNSMCVVGIAHNAKIGGIRMLDGDVTDAVEAASLSHNYLHIDIYSASWGPDDDGRTVDGPATLTKHAFERGITYGRLGKGSIFIWASGNGGKDADSCNCDGYTNSIYTLSISSAPKRAIFHGILRHVAAPLQQHTPVGPLVKK